MNRSLPKGQLPYDNAGGSYFAFCSTTKHAPTRHPPQGPGRRWMSHLSQSSHDLPAANREWGSASVFWRDTLCSVS